LKSLHEVVVRNRLEQLRKRQRDEALHAQEELLAGVARSAAQGLKDENYVAPVTTAEADMHEDMEPYDRSMSPPLIDIRKLTEDEREIDIVTELDDLRALVGIDFRFGQNSAYCWTVETTPYGRCLALRA
jgi:hypothetical protein